MTRRGILGSLLASLAFWRPQAGECGIAEPWLRFEVPGRLTSERVNWIFNEFHKRTGHKRMRALVSTDLMAEFRTLTPQWSGTREPTYLVGARQVVLCVEMTTLDQRRGILVGPGR